MLWLFNLWNVLQARSIAELGSFEQRVAQGHALFYERAGFRYLGTFGVSDVMGGAAAVEGARDGDGGVPGLPFSHAYVYLVDASSPKEAQDRIEGRPLSAAMEAVALERRSFNDTAGARAQLWLRPVILSTAGKTLESLPDGALLRLREGGKGQDNDRGRAARRAVSRYSEALEAVGWRYLGAYDALGLEGYPRADLLVTRAPSSGDDAQRAAARDASALIEELDLGEGTGRGGGVSSTAWLTPLAIPPASAPKR